MRVTHLNIKGFRSIESSPKAIVLNNLNILVGANNAGKSSIIKALHLLQTGSINPEDIRAGHEAYTVNIYLKDIPSGHLILKNKPWSSAEFSIYYDRKGKLSFSLTQGENASNTEQVPNKEPVHFVVPFLAKRKTASFAQDVRQEYALSIANDLQYLAAKLARISNPSYPTHDAYVSTCKAVLGFLISAVPSEQGLKPGIYLPDRSTIPIEQMGEGVPNIAALLISLAESRGKLFLIEEPENDLHPKALKALLDLIIESSNHNQFVISTHSNIVVRHLASVEGSKLYNVKTEPDVLPTKATIELVPQTVEARMAVLNDLGYSFSDFELWDGWLILEEASAERIIRDYLIPWFVPELTRVRTLSTGGADAVEPTFNDFNRLVRFTHLEEAYRNKGWVRIDGDAKGTKIVAQLKNSYAATWEADRFATYTENQFEEYYPKVFEADVKEALGKQGQERREAKKALLDRVRAWLDEDRTRAEAALKESAKEIIEDLQVIAAQLKST
ncbi:MAG: ATP-dependent nuclease [Methylophilus sp.]|uniref:ATP-dependent nuclease n=1 Tax=Methylophilus sp. TaxID=29541 RepID=UPI003F9FA321